MVVTCWSNLLKFRVWYCLMWIFATQIMGSLQDMTDHIPSRITRTDGSADRFLLSGTICSSQFCSISESKVISGEDQNDHHQCTCQCPSASPIFQDDISTCVQQIPESGGCPNTALFDGRKQEIISVVQLPPFGHTINRKINIEVADGDSERRCYVVDAQFLSLDGWTSFASIRLGNQPPRIKLVQQSYPPVPPPLPMAYQSDGPSVNWMSYNLQWLGSSEHAEFLQGRIILLTITCNTTVLSPVSLCFPMRIAGTFTRLRTLPLLNAGVAHHEGDHVETGVLVAAACGGALGILYVIVLAVFVTSRLRKSRKSKQQSDQEPPSHYDDADAHAEDLEKASVGTPEVQHITDPKHEYNTRSYAPWPEDMAFRYRLMQLRNRGLGSLPIRYIYSPPPFFLNDVVIIQTPDVISKDAQMHDVMRERLENKTLPKPPVRRRKLFFDPRFFDTDHLKHPTDEAEQFRAQIHCMINVTKSRLDKRRFLPNLEMINEESLSRRAGAVSPEGMSYCGLTDSSGCVRPSAVARMEPVNCSAINPGIRKTSRDLDAVVLQMNKSAPVGNPVSPPVPSVGIEVIPDRHEDWAKILKEEWGSNESLPQIPHRRRINEVFQKNWGAIAGSTSSLASVGQGTLPKQSTVVDPVQTSYPLAEQTLLPAQPTVKIKIVSETMPAGPVPAKTVDEDDRESDKGSSRSGTGSNPEKDSGIEDDVNSDKPNKVSSHKIGKPDNVPGMISRKKIVNSATVQVSQKPTKPKPVSGSLRERRLPAS